MFFLILLQSQVFGQIDYRVKNQPYVDQKMFHLGFLLSLHTQDMILTNSGHINESGEAWFAEIPSYSPGFSVGLIGDRYLNGYFNLRLSPTLHFGEKKYVFREQTTGEEYKTSVKSHYLSLPLHVKFSAGRMHNARPYLLAGGYASMEIAPKKNLAVRYKKMDYGIEFGLGCNIYLPLFKLCPELKFSLGLVNMINTDVSDVSDNDILKYRNAISSGKTRMISLTFNFE